MTAYEILGVRKGASPTEVKAAYRALAKIYHPDVNPAGNAAAFFRLIQEAYEELSVQGGSSTKEWEEPHAETCARPEQTTDFAREEKAAPTHEQKQAVDGRKIFFKAVKIITFPLVLLADVVLVGLLKVLPFLLPVARAGGMLLCGIFAGFFAVSQVFHLLPLQDAAILLVGVLIGLLYMFGFRWLLYGMVWLEITLKNYLHTAFAK